jgi:hypothetical protein
MTIIKVYNKSENKEGYVDVYSWANPKTGILDFQEIDSTDYYPVYKDNLDFVDVEEV